MNINNIYTNVFLILLLNLLPYIIDVFITF